MNFKVTGSPIETMNGEFEVSESGAVRKPPHDPWFKPAIDLIVKWMCEKGYPGTIWIGSGSWNLRPGIEDQIMLELGFGHWLESRKGRP
jgi:hypothetical protein